MTSSRAIKLCQNRDLILTEQEGRCVLCGGIRVNGSKTFRVVV